MKFKVGDRVKTKYGVGEIIAIDGSDDVPYLVGIKGLKGHNGIYFIDENIAKNAGYENQCWWFKEEGLELVEEEKEMKIFKKDDLKTGMLVVMRNGRELIFLKDYETINWKKGVFADVYGAVEFDKYDENLKFFGYADFDIMKVYVLKNGGYVLSDDMDDYKLLWEREENPTITTTEKVILENLPKEYKWIARDGNGGLFVYHLKPTKSVYVWYSQLNATARIPLDGLFNLIKWEDKEPWLIEDLLKLEVEK